MQVSPLPPVVIGGALIVPAGLLDRAKSGREVAPSQFAHDTERVAKLALDEVLASELSLGFVPRAVSDEKCGYDVESSIPGTGRLRFIEVKGRAKGADTVTVTKNEILTALNKPEDFILAIVEIDGEVKQTRYIYRPFEQEPDFAVTSINYNLHELLAKSRDPF